MDEYPQVKVLPCEECPEHPRTGDCDEHCESLATWRKPARSRARFEDELKPYMDLTEERGDEDE